MRRRDIRRLSRLLLNPAGLKASFTWPVFSVTSFEMVANLVRRGIAPSTIIDVGANIGQFTIAAAKAFPCAHIHSFEPLPDCTTILRRNVSRLKYVTVHSMALGEYEGQTTM